MIAALIAELAPYAIAIGGALAALFAYGRRKKKQGREETYIEALKDRVQREEQGHEAANELRGADRADLDDRLRRNDGLW